MPACLLCVFLKYLMYILVIRQEKCMEKTTKCEAYLVYLLVLWSRRNYNILKPVSSSEISVESQFPVAGRIESQYERLLCAKALLTHIFTHVATNTDEKVQLL